MDQLYCNQQPVEGAIEVISTSKQTAKVEAFPLRSPTNLTRLAFHPTLVNNPNCHENSISGKIVYERKSKKEELFPSERGDTFVSKSTVHKCDALEISLSTSEVRQLYLGLQELYQMYEDIGGVQGGTASYVPVNRAVRTLLDLLQSDNSVMRQIGCQETLDLVKEFLGLLTKGKTHEELAGVLERLDNIDLQQLSSGLNLEMLERAAEDIENNLNNDNEEYWQSTILGTHPWVVGHLFSSPCVLFGEKAYVGGKAINNRGGNVVDFLYQNKVTSNVALIEIKTPCTVLMGKRYRNNSYSISPELSGAVTQVLSYRQSLLNNYRNLIDQSTGYFEACSPSCVVIAGNTHEFSSASGKPDPAMLASFENFRGNLNGIYIVTYDELLEKVRYLISVLRGEGSVEGLSSSGLQEKR